MTGPGPREKFDKTRKKHFLQDLAECGSVTQACKNVNVKRNTAYTHRKNPRNIKFKEAWDRARDMAVDKLEDEAFRRAHDGVERDVYYKGEVVGKERVYSDTLLMHRLNAEKPHKYFYRAKMDANVTGELTVTVVKFADNDTK